MDHSSEANTTTEGSAVDNDQGDRSGQIVAKPVAANTAVQDKKELEPKDEFQRFDNEPTVWSDFHLEIPNKFTGVSSIPRFDCDDGSWAPGKAESLPRRIIRNIHNLFKLMNNILILILTCGAAEHKLTTGFEKYPLFTRKYGLDGPGRYKHTMKLNRSDFHQRNLKKLSTENPGRRVSQLPTRMPTNFFTDGAGVTDETSNSSAKSSKVSPGEGTDHRQRRLSNGVTAATLKSCIKKPRSGDGSEPRKKKNLEIYREVRIVVFASDTEARRKASMWVTSDVIMKNKKEHKKEKQKLELQRKKAAADRALLKAKEAESESAEGKNPPTSKNAADGKAGKDSPTN